ncbi:MAG: Ycf66 family protein [Oscillatoriaceae bacterium SKW80]|nr:Ycf66 family protein [Oscillatoriaceae bacterium SKYG93]MCX8121886.1 Ycf66 family protein [Oscillatoriaceae bacterium SKW80]MDW8454647.1 Ycf66 family protein [Oscillatoriaceae cyanobacterium SKYGB_i_bin93]HIK28647.1 hypothetical protein [Oscillatoriaceae cyanobacterium M7585_C2015_266]
MLAYILAITVLVGSFIYYMSAFFFPEVHRKGDFIWSGVGLFYALVLWFCAGRITGAVLLGQIASVALIVWFGWQTLQLRRQVTPSELQTPVSQETLQAAVSPLRASWLKFFQRPAVVATTPEKQEITESVEERGLEEITSEIATGENARNAPEIISSTVESPEVTLPTTEDLPAAAALSGSTTTDAPEVPISAIESPEVTPPTTEDLPATEQLPSAAALSGATAEDDNFDIEEGFEPEPQELKIEEKAVATKAESKDNIVVKSTIAKKGSSNLLAPVTGLVTALSRGIGELFGKVKKAKPEAPVKKSESQIIDKSKIVEEEELPLEVEATLEIDTTLSEPAQASESGQEEKATAVETTEISVETAEVETLAETSDTIEKAPELMHSNLPASEMVAEIVEAAGEAAVEIKETTEIPVEEVAAEVKIVPPAEVSPEAIETATAKEESQTSSEKQGFAELITCQRVDAPALVETAKKSAEAPIQMPSFSEGEDSLQPG